MDGSIPGSFPFSSSSSSSSSSSTQTINFIEKQLSLIPETELSNSDNHTPFENQNLNIHSFSSLTTQLSPPQTQSVDTFKVTSSTYRVSRLPPAPTIYQAGPSKSPQRYLFFAIRKGHKAGVYTVWHEAEKQIINHPEPVFKTFSTKLAAEAFVAGWDGAGRHSLPYSTPRPLREHLAMSFPGSVNISTSPQKRQSYHTRLLASPTSSNDFSPSPIDTTRPSIANRNSYHRHSMVKVSSPLRLQVDEEEEEYVELSGSRLPPLRKAASFIGIGGLLSPPQSPEKQHGKPLSVMDRERPTKPKSNSDGATWSSRNHREFSSQNGGLGLVARPLSPPQTPSDKRATIHGGSVSRPSPSRTPSGLWADTITKPNQSSPLSPNNANQPEFNDPSAPKFSRSGLKKSGVVMPVAAKRTGSSQSLRSRTSLSNLVRIPSGFESNNSSSSSINSTWSGSSSATARRSSSVSSFSQDRLSTLAETSKKELQLNEEGLLALSSLSPPRPAFMMRRSPSNSSVGSNDSESSMGSLTSNSSSNLTSSLDSCEPIQEEEDDVAIIGEEREDIIMSCTKSDGDADGSIGDKDSIIQSKKKIKNGGGMFKRLAKALKLEKKSNDRDSLRRGSM